MVSEQNGNMNDEINRITVSKAQVLSDMERRHAEQLIELVAQISNEIELVYAREGEARLTYPRQVLPLLQEAKDLFEAEGKGWTVEIRPWRYLPMVSVIIR